MACEDGSCSCGSKVGEYNLNDSDSKENKKIETKQIMPKRKKRAGKFTKAFYFVLKYLPAVTIAALLYMSLIASFISSSNPLVMVGIVLLFSAGIHWGIIELYRYGRKENAMPNLIALYGFYIIATVAFTLAGYYLVGRLLADLFYDAKITFVAGSVITAVAGIFFYNKKADDFFGKHEKKQQETPACSCG